MTAIIALGALSIGFVLGLFAGIESAEPLPYAPPRPRERPTDRAQREDSDEWNYAADVLGLPRQTVPEPEGDETW